MHGEMVYVAETARDTVLVFRKYHTLPSSLTSRHTLCLFHSFLLLLLLLLLLVPLCSMLYAGLHVCRCVAACSIAGSSPRLCLLPAPRSRPPASCRLPAASWQVPAGWRCISSACSCLVPYASCLQLLSSRRFSLQCKMKVMYRCMQE